MLGSLTFLTPSAGLLALLVAGTARGARRRGRRRAAGARRAASRRAGRRWGPLEADRGPERAAARRARPRAAGAPATRHGVDSRRRRGVRRGRHVELDGSRVRPRTRPRGSRRRSGSRSPSGPSSPGFHSGSRPSRTACFPTCSRRRTPPSSTRPSDTLAIENPPPRETSRVATNFSALAALAERRASSRAPSGTARCC